MISTNPNLQNDCTFITAYAEKHGFTNTLKAIRLVKDMMDLYEKTKPADAELHYTHCFTVVRMFTDLHMTITPEEEDIAMAAGICHVIPECLKDIDFQKVIVEDYGLDPEIHRLIRTITRPGGIQAEAEQIRYYQTIQDSKLATLVKLCDRAIVVSSLYKTHIWQSKEFIFETRKFFFPLCIHAKEVYPDCYGAVSILMEKMRSLIDASEILMNRFEAKESEMNLEIIELKEENARIRNIIRSLKAEQQ